MAMLELQHVHFSYKNHLVFQDVNLSLEAGKIIGLVAPNGTGKSTFINLLAGILKNYQGTILYNGQEYKRHFSQVRHNIVKMPNQDDLFQTLSGRDHLRMFSNLLGSDAQVIDTTIARLNMTSYIDKRVASYSLGMRQRLAFAMTLVTDATVLLLDEVMNSLDPSNVDMVSTILKEEARTGKTIVLVSHLLDNLEELSNQIIFLKNHRIILDYCPHEQVANQLDIIYKDKKHAKELLQHLPLSKAFDHQHTFSYDISLLEPEEVEKVCQYLLAHLEGFESIRFGRKTCQTLYSELYKGE